MQGQQALTLVEVKRELGASRLHFQRDMLLNATPKQYNWTCTGVALGALDFLKLANNLSLGRAPFLLPVFVCFPGVSLV